ncbi:MAG: FAD-binding protein [Candidatus Hodarchaeota archaeon]
MEKVIDTDVLIVGGGAAGVWAAIRAYDNGLKPYLACKGLVGKSGATLFAGILGGYRPPEGYATPQFDWFNMLVKYKTHWLGDHDYMKSLAEYTGGNFLRDIEEIGVYIRRKADGKILTNIGKSLITVAPKWGLSSMVIMEYLKSEMIRRNIEFVEETYVTSLLMNNGRVVGATLLNILSGEFYVVRAKAVFMATGLANVLCKRSTGTREQVGNGIAMAYKAGAPIQGLEQQWFHTNDIARPKCWQRLHLFPNQIPGTSEVGWMRNSDGEVFFTQNQFPYCVPPYFMQCRQLIKEVYNGKAKKDRGYYQDYRHVEPEVLEEHAYQLYPLKKLGINPNREIIEVGMSWHMTFGGIRVNNKMESEVKGLYALGGVTGTYCAGVNAASHDPMLIEREGVFEDVKGEELLKLNEREVDDEKNRLFNLLRVEPRDGYLPAQVKKRIREIMWEHMSYNKNEKGMVKALEELAEVKEKYIPRMRLDSLARGYNWDWVDAIDIEDMLISCEIAIQESRFRKESRGPHYREDYPFVDNRNWIVNVVAKKVSGEMKIYKEPIELKYATPDEPLKEDFLSCLW